jgi:hypothetical protein
VLHLLLLYHGSEFTTDARPNECREIMLLHRYVQLEVWRHLPQETKCSTPPDYASVSCTLLQQTIADQMRECSGSFSLGRTLFTCIYLNPSFAGLFSDCKLFDSAALRAGTSKRLKLSSCIPPFPSCHLYGIASASPIHRQKSTIDSPLMPTSRRIILIICSNCYFVEECLLLAAALHRALIMCSNYFGSILQYIDLCHIAKRRCRLAACIQGLNSLMDSDKRLIVRHMVGIVRNCGLYFEVPGHTNCDAAQLSFLTCVRLLTTNSLLSGLTVTFSKYFTRHERTGLVGVFGKYLLESEYYQQA